MSKPSRLKTLSVNVLLSVVATLVGLFGVNVALRVFAPWHLPSPAFTDPQTGRFMQLREHVRNTHVKIDWRGESIDFRVDREGYMVPSRVHESADLDVYFLGGSTTETLYVAETSRWPYLVGRELENRLGVKVNAFNAGVSGSHAMHAVVTLMGKVLKERPHIVVYMENTNDLNVLLVLGDYWIDSRTRGIVQEFQPRAPQLGAGWRLAYAVRDVLAGQIIARVGSISRDWFASANRLPPADIDEFARFRGHAIPIEPERVFARREAALASIVALTRAWGGTPVLMTQAHRLREPIPQEIVRDLRAFTDSYSMDVGEYAAFIRAGNANIRRFAAETGVPLIDLDAGVEGTEDNMYDIIHFTRAGSERAAAVVAEGLLPIARAVLADRLGKAKMVGQ